MGVVGCVIMTHNVFLHSVFVQSKKIDPHRKGQVQEVLNYNSIESTIALILSFIINQFVTVVFAKRVLWYGTSQ